jgi:hypothetical protein
MKELDRTAPKLKPQIAMYGQEYGIPVKEELVA